MTKTKLTPQEALKSTKRKQYAVDEVVATMPEATGGQIEFFKLDKRISDYELEKEYENRGLVPASPINICIFDMEKPDFMDEKKYVATHWKDANGDWCFTTFYRWHGGERRVDVDRHGLDWVGSWWFAGVRK